MTLAMTSAQKTVPLPCVLAIVNPGRLTDPEYFAAYLGQLMEHAPTLASAHHPDDPTRREAFHRAYLEHGLRSLAEAIRETIGTRLR